MIGSGISEELVLQRSWQICSIKHLESIIFQRLGWAGFDFQQKKAFEPVSRGRRGGVPTKVWGMFQDDSEVRYETAI